MIMANKPNPLLASLEAKKEREFKYRLQGHIELDMIAMLMAAHNELKVGPGRAGFLLAEYLDVKMQIASAIMEDVGDSHKKGGDGDPEFLHTKKELAVTLRSILGDENWEKYKELFPICRDYWE